MSLRFGNIAVGEIPLGDVAVGMAYIGDVLVYRRGGQAPYLEIEPDLIWVNPDWGVDNDVLSNVTWNVH